MKRMFHRVGGVIIAAAVVIGGSGAASGQADQNPFAMPGTVTCEGESLDVLVVGIPQAEPGSEAAGRPGIAIVVGETTRLIPKSLTATVYVNGRLVFEGSWEWGFGVPNLTACSQVIEFTGPSGNTVRTELDFQVLLTPPRQAAAR